MHFEKFPKSDGQGTTLEFNEQEVPIVGEILRAYSVKNAEKLERTQWLGYVVHSFLATAAEHDGPIKVNLEAYAYPLLVAIMNQQLADYEDDLLAFRQVLTTLPLALLRADIPGESLISHNTTPDDTYYQGLLDFDEKIERVDRLATRFEYLSKLNADQ